MSDFIVDGQPLETPIASANQSYAQTPPTLERAFGAYFGQSSTLGAIQRQSERESQSARAPRQPEPYEMYNPTDEGEEAPTPTLSADDINKLYAPEGTTITDHPMPDGLGKLIGRQKQEEMDRENVLERFSASRSSATQFGVGLAAFLTDPLNLASSFVPGLGEETGAAAIARIGLTGKGLVAKTAARALTGATGAVAAQVPITGLRYGLGLGQASDYDAYDAMKDIGFAAAGGAILHAGFGAAGDALRTRATLPGNVAEAPAGAPPGGDGGPAGPILNADAITRDAAMRSSVSQVVTGRPVDVSGVFPETPWFEPEATAETPDVDVLARKIAPDAYREFDALGARKEVLARWMRELQPTTVENIEANPPQALTDIDGQIAAVQKKADNAGARMQGRYADQLENLNSQRTNLMADLVRNHPDIAQVRTALIEHDLKMRDLAEEVSAARTAAQDQIDRAQFQKAVENGLPRPPGSPEFRQAEVSTSDEIAQRQQRLYRDGFAPGMTQDQLLASEADLLGAKEAPEEGVAPVKPEPKLEPEAAPEGGAPSEQVEHDPEMEALEQSVSTENLSTEERAELDRTAAGLDRATRLETASQQAAQCLIEGGA